MMENYSEHEIFKQISRYSEFYDHLSFAIFPFISMGTNTITNIDSYVFTSMQGTLESIKEVLNNGRINDAYALLRKYFDAVIINTYSALYLEENFSVENFIVETIDNWVNGKKQLPSIRIMNSYIQQSKKTGKIYKLLHQDDRYKELKERCNDNMHYNFYKNILLNNKEYHSHNWKVLLTRYSKDLENIFIMHFAYMFTINSHYMMSSDYIDALDIGFTPEENSQYIVAPFIQELFTDVIMKNRMDLAIELKNSTSMMLE